MPLSLSIQPLMFAANPALLTVNTADLGESVYVVTRTDVTPNVELYRGVIDTGASNIQIDLSFLFHAFINLSGISTYTITLGEDDDQQSADFKIYGGGISKLAIRNNAGTTNYIQAKLNKLLTNFLLTTRSASATFFIPENELCTLYYYTGHDEPRKKFSIKSGSDILENIDHTTDEAETCASLNLKDIRLSHFNNTGKLINVFDFVSTDTNEYCFTVVVTEAESASWALRFRNSFGVQECLAISNELSFIPKFSDAENNTVYDALIADFVDKIARNTYQNAYNIAIPVLATNNKSFYTDLFASSDVDLEHISTGKSYPVTIKAASDLMFNKQADVIQAIITFTDTEYFATPLYDADYNSTVMLNSGQELSVTDDPDNKVLTQ